MIDAEDEGVGRRGRRRRSVSEKLRIVQLTMEPGASVAEIARAHELNANQVFKWRRLPSTLRTLRGLLIFHSHTARGKVITPSCPEWTIPLLVFRC